MGKSRNAIRTPHPFPRRAAGILRAENHFSVCATRVHLPPFLQHKPRRFFAHVKRLVLGESFELSLVLSGDTLATRLNKKYRKKTYAPNVLSFPISKREGEIILNARVAEREARAQNIPLETHLLHLFIHGCLHLKGLAHGRTMEAKEFALLARVTH